MYIRVEGKLVLFNLEGIKSSVIKFNQEISSKEDVFQNCRQIS
jgi:hypothetical protein